MKVNQLEGVALDWAVTKAEGFDSEVDGPVWGMWKWATDWGQGGPIIERERISVATDDVEPWCGFIEDGETNVLFFSGPTPLVAAMRCYVASHFGDEIEVPDELMEGPSK